MLSRRDTLLGALALGACAPRTAPDPRASFVTPTDDPRFAAVEQRVDGRVGVAVWNTGTDEWLGHRRNQAFAMCSTFKWLLAAHMLFLDMHRPGFRDVSINYREADLLDHAPTTRANVARGSMTVEELCEAAVVVSDNTAANLLLVAANGPEGFTHFLRSNGDGVTRLDRTEPSLNENLQGDLRDTTTPDAMARTLKRFLLDDGVLSATPREKLIGWMVASTTGLARLRAGLPSGWRVGDKTGTGARGSTNDVSVIWPPGRAPIVIACYLSGSERSLDERNAAHAEVARIVAETWS